MHNMGVLFLATRWVSIEIVSDLIKTYVVRFPFDTLDTIISRILTI